MNAVPLEITAATTTLPREVEPLGPDLFEKAPALRRFLGTRSFQFLLIYPNLVFFYILMLAGIFGHPLGNLNSAIVLIWILWWFLLITLLVPIGARVWCAICPLAGPGEWLQRRSIVKFRGLDKPRGLNKRWPKPLRNIWAQNFGFLGLAVISGLLVTRPIVTVVVIGGIWVFATALMLVYRRRAFCVYLCPVSGFQGLYSMVAPIALRSKNREVCKGHKPKTCMIGSRKGDDTPLGYACPWFEYIGDMDRNNYCGLCMECLKGCTKDNIGLFWRGGKMDVVLHGRDEAWKAFIMTALAGVYAIVLQGPVGTLKDWANAPSSGSWGGFAVLAATMFAVTLVVLPAVYAPFVEVSRRATGKVVEFRDLFVRGAFGLVPLGLAAWIAFSVPLVLINGAYILQVISDPFGWGWNLFGTKYVAWNPVGEGWIPLIQALLVLVGLAVGIIKTHRALEPMFERTRQATRAMVPLAGFLTLIAVIFFVVFLG
ncbi:MAG: 4Fe-4S binding protein [Acidimicrobiia bacterium]|nr:MAG: 4Fe-4S binding protein [Acidimicrobiia bacterium]